MQTKDYFSYIREFDHKLGIFFTFTLDKEVINKIRENTSGRTIILHDYRQGVSSDPAWKNRVLCIPVFTKFLKTDTCFHAKIALLKGADRARILLGSMNLSRSSFSGYKEMCYAIDVDYSSSLYASIIQYFLQLPLELLNNHWKSILDELNMVHSDKRGASQNGTNGLFVNNVSSGSTMAASVLRFIESKRYKDRPTMRIVTPFVSDSYGDDLTQFIAQVNPKKTYLYLRDRTKLPREIANGAIPNVSIIRPKAQRKTFHAKLILLEYEKKTVLYVGSANITRPGFFLELPTGGNAEHGIIVELADKRDIIEWLTKGWDKPVGIDEWNGSEVIAVEMGDSMQSYAWAERKDGKKVELYLMLSKPEIINKIRVDGKKTLFNQVGPSFYQAVVQSSREMLVVNLHDEDIKLHIFDANVFENAKRDDGENLFSIDNNILDETIREDVLKREIQKKGIRIASKGVTIVEPPLLEQLYYNIRHVIKLIGKRRTFDASHLNELKKELQLHQNASGIYFMMQLYKVFHERKLDVFENICLERLNELIKVVQLPEKSFSGFLSQWSANNGKV